MGYNSSCCHEQTLVSSSTKWEWSSALLSNEPLGWYEETLPCEHTTWGHVSKEPNTGSHANQALHEYPCFPLGFFGRHPRWLSGKTVLPMQETQVQIPGSGRSPGEGNGNPLQCSCLRNPMDRGVWWAAVHGIARVRHDLATKQQSLLPAWSPGQLLWFESGPLLHTLSFPPSVAAKGKHKCNGNRVATGHRKEIMHSRTNKSQL